ncbi:MAG: type II toxin-antitoxin system VapC family toxin [Gaiellaceae bacterium]
MIVADTSVLVDYLRGDAGARAAFEHARSAGEPLVGSVLTCVEVLAGARRPEERSTRALLDELEWIPVDVELADAAGSLARRFGRTHPGIDVTDYVIAATVDHLDATLWTRNLRHFPMFPRLAAPY